MIGLRAKVCHETTGPLVAEGVAVIAATGGNLSGRAAQAATDRIPIVFTAGRNPLDLGLVKSLSRPEANLTGINLYTNELDQKRIELMTEILPGRTRMGILHIHSGSEASTIEAVESAARLLGLSITRFTLEDLAQLGATLDRIKPGSVDWVLVQYATPLTSRRSDIVQHMNSVGMPAIYGGREYVQAGGLVSYGSDLAHAFTLVGRYTGKILRGVRVADLPVVQALKLELSVNSSTLSRLGLQLPSDLAAIVDETFE